MFRNIYWRLSDERARQTASVDAGAATSLTHFYYPQQSITQIHKREHDWADVGAEWEWHVRRARL